MLKEKKNKMNSLTDVQKNILQAIAEKEQITNFDLVINVDTVKGENYLGLIKNVIIKDKDSKKELNLILKVADSNPNIRKNAPVKNFFTREIFIYEVLMEEFKKLSKHTKFPFSGYAKYFGSCKEELSEFLVLNNLKADGYKLFNRKLPMDMEHIKATLKEYGKFHSYSLALKCRKPEFFKDLRNKLTNVFGQPSTEKVEALIPIIFGRLLQHFKDNQRISEALNAYVKDGAFKFIYKEFGEADSYKHAVVHHGDCWTNNFLYKYEDLQNPNIPTKVCFIDFQMSRVTHPAIDLTYFIFVCLPKNILYDYKNCLTIYYESLRSHLEELIKENDINEFIFSYSEMVEDFKKYSKFGLQIAIIIIKILVSESCEAVDLVAELGSGKNLYEALLYPSVNDDVYLKRIEDILNFMIDEQML